MGTKINPAATIASMCPAQDVELHQLVASKSVIEQTDADLNRAVLGKVLCEEDRVHCVVPKYLDN